MKIRSPKYHREIPQRYRLEGAKTTSGKVYFPPRVVYPGGESAQPYKLATTGKVLTFTIINTSPAEHSDLTPFALAIVELDDGARITTQVVDCDPAEVKTGMRVRVEFRRIRTEGVEGLICYGYKVVEA